MTQASARNVGTCRPGAKGNVQAATPQDGISIPGTGAEQPVVVMKGL